MLVARALLYSNELYGELEGSIVKSGDPPLALTIFHDVSAPEFLFQDVPNRC